MGPEQKEFRLTLRAQEDEADEILTQIREYIDEMWGDDVVVIVE